MKTKSQSCIFRSGLLIGALIIGLLFAGYIIVGNMKNRPMNMNPSGS